MATGALSGNCEANMQKINPYVYLFAMGHFASDWAQGAWPALLPYFISVCHLNYQEAGSLIFANMLLASITQPFFGYYSDKISKPWFIPAGPILCGLSLAVIPFTTSYWVIFVCSMLCGLGSAVFHPEAAQMVNKISGNLKGQALGTFSVGGNAGFAIGPMVVGLFAYKYDIHGLLLFGMVNFVLAIILYLKMGTIIGQAQEFQTVVEKSHPQLERKNDWGAFSKLSVIIFARSTGFTICNSFIPIYWINVLGTSPATGSMALTILFALGAVITFLGGILADRLGFIKILRSAFIVMVPAMFFLTHSTDVTTATLLLIPAAYALFGCYSPIVVLGQTYLGKNVGFASGVTMGLGTTIGGIMAPLVGRAADYWGIATALQVLWIAGLAAAVFSFLLPRSKELE
jgi:FSR family fosmidomycin resistance protein-like MFS transporter